MATRKITKEDGLVLELYDNGTAAVIAHTGYERTIRIPESVEGHQVTAIRSGVFSTGSRWKLHIPATVTNIGSLPTGYSEKRVVPTTHFLKEMGPDFDSPGFTPTTHTITQHRDVFIYVVQGSYAQQYCQKWHIPYSVEFSKSAAEDPNLQPYEYEILKTGNIHLKKYRGTEEIVTVPAYLDGYQVTGISNWTFSHCQTVRKIVIPNGVKILGTISDCENLEAVYIPESVEWFTTPQVISCPKLTVFVKKGSAADRVLAKENIRISYRK